MVLVPQRGFSLRMLTAASLCGVAVLAGSSIGPHALASAPAAGAGTLTIGLTSGIDTFDPSLNESGLPRGWLLQPVYDTLIRESANGKYVARLATKWSRPNKTTFEMVLRSGVKFTDGSVFNAAAVKANIDHALADKGPDVALLSNIKSVSVVNAHTVKVNLSSPDPDLEATFSRPDLGAMVSPKAIADPTTLAQTPDGTGPYVLDKAQSVAGDHYTFTRKSSYWDSKAFPYGTVIVKVIPNSTSLLNAAITGQVDFDPSSLSGGPNSEVPQAQQGGLNVLKTPPVSVSEIGLLDRVGKLVPALKDVRVRQALNYAVDRKAIVKVEFQGYGVPVSGVLPPTAKGYDKAMDNYYTYNPTKAKALLKAAGYSKGFTFTLLTIPAGATSAEIFAGYLKKIGVTLKIQTTTDFSLFYTQKYASIPGTIDAQSAFSLVQRFFVPSAFFNPFHASDKVIVTLAKKAAATTGAAQTKIYKQIDDRATRDAWFLTVGGQNLFVFVSKKVAGVQVTKTGHVYFYGWHSK